MAKFCSQCGNILSEGDRFCMKCGAPVSVEASTTVQIDPTIQANEWFQKGMAYPDGKGVKQDFKKADEAFQKALGFGKKESLSWIGIARLYQSAAILRSAAETALVQKRQSQEEMAVGQKIGQGASAENVPAADDPLPVIPEK